MSDWTIKPIQNKLYRHIIIILIVIALMILSVWTKAIISSWKDFSRGKDFFTDKQYIRAITFFDRSMHWYAPFNPYIEKSAEYLWKIGNLPDQGDEGELNLIALESIRNSFYSVRSFYSPGIDWIEKSENKIHDILMDKNKYSSMKKDLFNSFAEFNDPDIFWTIILETGLFGWIVTVLIIIFISLGNKKQKYFNVVWIWIVLSVFSYGLWIVGMIKA